MKKTMYLNIETRELLTATEMREQGAELYDLDDPTNILSYADYYEKVVVSEEETLTEGVTKILQ